MARNFNLKNSYDTSWEKVSDWYDTATGEKGHYYQENVIIPKSLELLELQNDSKVLDLGCGQGVFSRSIPVSSEYVGVDLSSNLIQFARQRNKNKNFMFKVSDVSKPMDVPKNYFTHGCIILALQNIEDMNGVFMNASKSLIPGGKFLIVLNHPNYRIPRQSSWEIDQQNKLQYRRINRYMNPLKIPINMTPGQGNSRLTWSFHNPVSAYSKSLKANGFVIELIDEWISPKHSEGRVAKMENRSREEFPLFMAILAVKQ